MSDLLFFDKKNNKITSLKSEEEILERIEFKISENRTKKIIAFLKEKTNEWFCLRGTKQTKKSVEQNITMFSMPMIFIYLPQYYQRIFLKLALLSSRKPGSGFGYCELTLTEFYLILSDWDRAVFKEVFKFLINCKIIKVNNLGAIKIEAPYSFGVFGFDLRTLKMLETTYNKFHSRNFKSKGAYTFITDFEKI